MATEHCFNLISAVCFGALSFLRGLLHLLRALVSPSMLSSSKVLRELLLTPALVAWVMVMAGLMWVVCIPVKKLGWFEPSWSSLVRVSSLIALECMRQVIGWFAPNWFFHVLQVRDRELAARLRGKPVVNGLRQRMRHWLLILLSGATLAFGVVVCAPLAASISVAGLVSSAVLVVTWPAVLGAVAVTVALLLLLGGYAYLFAFFGPFLKLFKLDPIFGCIAIFAVALRFLSIGSIGAIVRWATILYYSGTLMTSQLLGLHGERLSHSEWASFKRRHCWEMFGFGLPICLLMQVSPLAVVASLQALHGASSCLLADLLEKEGES